MSFSPPAAAAVMGAGGGMVNGFHRTLQPVVGSHAVAVQPTMPNVTMASLFNPVTQFQQTVFAAGGPPVRLHTHTFTDGLRV